jgi:autotransporter-associated beta strand protein
VENPLTNGGTLNVIGSNTSTATLSIGTLTNTGVLTTSASSIPSAVSAVISGIVSNTTGTINIDTSTQLSGTLTNSNMVSIATGATLSSTGLVTQSGGQITIAPGGVLSIPSTTSLAMNNGTITLDADSISPGVLKVAHVTSSAVAGVGTIAAAPVTLGQQQGYVQLGGLAPSTFTVSSGTAPVQLIISAPMTNGRITKSGTGVMELTGVNTYFGGTTVAAGTLLIGPTGTPNTVALPDGAVTVDNTAELEFGDNASASTPNNVNNQLMQISSLSLITGATLDVRNNHFFVADPGGAADDTTYTTILGEIANGIYNGTAGYTSAPGGIIISTEGLTGPNYGVGLVDGNDGVHGTLVSANEIEVGYTLEGDANLDGKVDASDFSIFAPNFGLNTSLGWEAGDFNYDGKVDASDFSAFAPNFGLQDNGTAISLPAADYAALDAFAAANGLTITSVPEPATLGMLTLGATALLARRRRLQIRGR